MGASAPALRLGQAVRPKVLYISPDRHRLGGYQDTLADTIAIHGAIGRSIAIGVLENQGPFDVVVVDLGPGTLAEAESLLERIYEVDTEACRILVVEPGQLVAGCESACRLDLFRCLPSPAAPEIFAKAVEAGMRARQDRASLEDVLKETLRGSVKALTDILALVNPTVFSRTSRVSEYVRHAAQALGAPRSWEIELASMLARIGCITLPQDTLDRYFSGRPLEAHEERMVRSLPEITAAMLANVPRLDGAVRMIQGIEQPFRHRSRSEVTGGVERERLASEIIKAALDFDQRIVAGESPRVAARRLAEASLYNPKVLAALSTFEAQASEERTVRAVRTKELADGMVLDEDVHAKSGVLLVQRGQTITYDIRKRLQALAESGVGVAEPIRVLVQESTDGLDRFS